MANTKAEIRYGGNQAYYALQTDRIQMPPFETFRDAECHAATLAHELTHWTRHPSRLNRETSAANALATKATRWKNWLPSLAPLSCVPI